MNTNTTEGATMSGVTRHPRLARPVTVNEKRTAAKNAVTMLAALGMALGLVLLLGIYVGAVGAEPKPRKSTPTHIVAAGDSIVAGSGAPVGLSWPDRMLAHGAKSVSNVGHGGQCLVVTYCGHGEPLLSSFDREVLAQRPDVAIVAIGRNDLCHVTTDVLIESYLRLRGRARAVGTTVYFGTITPAGASWPWPCEEQRIEVNDRLRRLPNVIDFEAATINRRGLLRWVFDSGDGVHLNAAGYDVLGAAAWAAVR